MGVLWCVCRGVSRLLAVLVGRAGLLSGAWPREGEGVSTRRCRGEELPPARGAGIGGRPSRGRALRLVVMRRRVCVWGRMCVWVFIGGYLGHFRGVRAQNCNL